MNWLSMLFAMILSGLIVTILTLLTIRWYLGKVLAQIRAYFEPQGEGLPSGFGAAVIAISDQVASSITMHLKTTFMGMQSGESRTEKAIAGDLLTDAASQISPALGAVLEMFPSLRKRLVKNPKLIETVGSILAKKGGDGQKEFDFLAQLSKMP
jgi:hypothetical protein